jgi:hypothetical protein
VSDRVLNRALKKAATQVPAQSAACLDDNTVAAYLDSTLSDAQMTAVEEHASVCESCRELIGLALRLGAPEIEARSPAPMKKEWWGWLLHPAAAMAAVAILAVGGAVFLLRFGSQETRHADQVAAVQAPATVPPVAPPAPTLQQAPAARFAGKDSNKPKAAADKGNSATGQTSRLEQLDRVTPAVRAPVADLAMERKAKSVEESESSAGAPSGAGGVVGGVVGGVAAPSELPPSAKEERAPADQSELRARGQDVADQPAGARSADEWRISAAAPASRLAYGKKSSSGPEEAVRRLRESNEGASHETRVVGQLRFFRIGSYWVDSRCLKTDQTTVVELKSDDPQLRSVVAGLPDLASLAGPGLRVLTVVEGTLYLLPEKR